MMKRLLTACLLLSTLILPAQTKKPIHTGTWWRAKSPEYKDAFVTGYKSGVFRTLGHDSELSPFGAQVVVAGVDKFYHDARNLNIEFTAAVHFVAEQLHGISTAQLDAELLKMRAVAAGAEPEE